MSVVTINPDASKRPVLENAGVYGPGMEHEADVRLDTFECPADRMPGYDRDGERGPYAYFSFRVITEQTGMIFFNHWEPIGSFTGSKLTQMLEGLGVGIEGDGNGSLQFDSEGVAPRDVAGIQVSAARNGYNGRLIQVIGA